MKKLLRILGLTTLLLLGACGGGGASTGGQVNNNPSSTPPAGVYKDLYSQWTLLSTNAAPGTYMITSFNLTGAYSTPLNVNVLYSTGCITTVTFQSDTLKEVVPYTAICASVGSGTFYAFWDIIDGILIISWDPQGGRIDYYL